MEQFYGLTSYPGVRVSSMPKAQDWGFLDESVLQAKMLDFTNGKTSRITFHIPAIHCVACVWLLENLFVLLPGVGKSQVNFPRREVSINFSADQVRLSQLVGFLISIGYEPELNLGQLEKKESRARQNKLWLQIGLAGFAFGNIMLFSLPTYLGLDRFSGPAFRALFGYLSLVLAAPVLIYSASDYWRSAWFSLRQKRLTLEVPIALGLLALYGQSILEVVSGRGEGYADSLAGLVFFLLCGRGFQQKTHERIAFDRDYKSFFPLSVTRRTRAGSETIGLASLQVGDRLLLRNGELIPADATLLKGPALIDYSFVTGEADPVPKRPGDYLYAGGQQVGGGIEIETVKQVSQSYLTSLWNHEAFQKDRTNDLNTLTNRYSRRFTRIVIAVAMGAAVLWAVSGNPDRGLKAFTSVLIVACPCALALAAPFALGTAQRLLAKVQVFVKNILVLERLAQIDAVVFDKTGTLTTAQSQEPRFCPAQEIDKSNSGPSAACFGDLTFVEKQLVCAVTSHSTHPYSRRIANALKEPHAAELEVSGYAETPGCGIEGVVQGHRVRLGARTWLTGCGISAPTFELAPGSVCCLAIDGQFRGSFVLSHPLRPKTDQLFSQLSRGYELALLSGDNEKERARFSCLFGERARLHFNQSPLQKLEFIRHLQESGKTVMMVGDGLNDAGALKQSDVGVAVVEKIGVFSPASDIILEAGQVASLVQILNFARHATRVVRASFAISALYNLAGISIAAAGILSPLICAVLMPLSSLSVVLFACGMTSWAARHSGLTLHAFNTPHSDFST
jgi:Cu+-exporting ATPase